MALLKLKQVLGFCPTVLQAAPGWGRGGQQDLCPRSWGNCPVTLQERGSEPGASSHPTGSPWGHPYLSFFAAFSVMEMWMTMGKISILCRVWTLCSWTSRRAWVFWRGQGRESGSQPGQVVEPTHSPEGTRRAAVCSRGALRGVCWGPWRLAASILISRSALPASCYHPPVEMQSPSPQHSCQPRPLPCL